MYFLTGKKEEGGASLLTKLTFSLLLVTFILVSSLYLVDYKSGQAKQFISELSPEVMEAIEHAQEGLDLALDKIKILASKVSASIGELVKKYPALEKVQDGLYIAFDKIRSLSLKHQLLLENYHRNIQRSRKFKKA